MTDYTIVIPTLDRPENMRQIMLLFPTAIVTMNESNVHLYKGLVPAGQILPHPDMPLIETRNWILDTIQTKCVMQFNDDVRRLLSLGGGRTRTHSDPRLIQQVIENTLQIADDLDIGVFCWSLTCNSSLLRPHLRPFRAAAPCSAHAFGVLGKARDRRLSTDYRGCGDFAYTLETLLEDRALLCDVRWHFACGGMSRGLGGQPGKLKPAEFAAGQAKLRKTRDLAEFFGKRPEDQPTRMSFTGGKTRGLKTRRSTSCSNPGGRRRIRWLDKATAGVATREKPTLRGLVGGRRPLSLAPCFFHKAVK